MLAVHDLESHERQPVSSHWRMVINTVKHGTRMLFSKGQLNVLLSHIYNTHSPITLRPPTTPELLASYNDFEKHAHGRHVWFEQQGDGYFKEQATVPQTIGYSLADSPVGLLAWIYEKLNVWSDSYPWEDDEGTYFLASYHNTKVTDHIHSTRMDLHLLVLESRPNRIY
jgi:hypothetical protein